MPGKRAWIDPVKKEIAKSTKLCRAELRELTLERDQQKADIELDFRKQWRKMEADYQHQIRVLQGQIWQYEERELAHRKSNDSVTQAAKAHLDELRNQLRTVRQEYSEERRARKLLFNEQMQQIDTWFLESRAWLNSLAASCVSQATPSGSVDSGMTSL